MNSDDSKACITAAGFLPEKIWRAAYSLSPEQRETCEEIRLRTGRPAKALVCGKIIALTCGGKMYSVTPTDLEEVITSATRSSLHSYIGQLKQGYITVQGGHRIGICGERSSDGENAVRSISSLNIRIAKQASGIADKLDASDFKSTLIISETGGGKTTLLREMSKVVSYGRSVSIADERYEIAGMHAGKSCFDIGDCDVMSGSSKSELIFSLMRSMTPSVIAVDEITESDDADALCTAAHCGCGFIATAHCGNIRDLGKRALYRRIMDEGVFENVIQINNSDGKRDYICYTSEGTDDKSDRAFDDNRIVLGNRVFRKAGSFKA
jgi:stage III sporulation protein AA